MSAPDQGNDDKGFLARWSQRKQEAKQPELEARVADVGTTHGSASEAEVPEEFDLSSLPSLDELTPETDITAFLRKGVPEHLRNAALRKAWALDPAIRNYVNPALDYAYDWNTPGGAPGSSELGIGMDVARLVSQIMGTDDTAAEPSVSTAEMTNAPAPPNEPAPDLPGQPLRLSGGPISVEQEPSNGDVGTPIQTEPTNDSEGSKPAAPQQPMRRHGSAKPIA
jgi:hypothetical protein